MALDAIGLHDRARDAVRVGAVPAPRRRLYWTGMNFDGDRFDEPGEYFTAEQPTWNSAAVVLAANALGGTRPDRGPVPRRGPARRASPPRSSSKPAPRSKPPAAPAADTPASHPLGAVI